MAAFVTAGLHFVFVKLKGSEEVKIHDGGVSESERSLSDGILRSWSDAAAAFEKTCRGFRLMPDYHHVFSTYSSELLDYDTSPTLFILSFIPLNKFILNVIMDWTFNPWWCCSWPAAEATRPLSAYTVQMNMHETTVFMHIHRTGFYYIISNIVSRLRKIHKIHKTIDFNSCKGLNCDFIIYSVF